ncbi:MAG: sulfatase-like hydrolase/transferase, partial [Candidatus Hydrogenedentes bacterium]|nr:sulfatase-like hydrolase/transferase [Candidatus Hydrogenedentota bacterium]
MAYAGVALPAAQAINTKTGSATNNEINILLIHADQHRMECLGAYGNPDIRTPHIDGLAKEGIRYENSFCPYPVCTPSRYSLLSGQYVHDHCGWTNHCTLSPEIATFPKILRDAGYTTRAIGKMHFTPTYLDVGFDTMTLAEQDGPGRWDDDYHRELMAAGLVDVNDLEDQVREYRRHARPEYWETFGALPSNLPEKWHTTSWVGTHAAAALENWNGNGNLLMTGFVKPHHPFEPPAS